MTDAPATTPEKKPAPWRGRRRSHDVKGKCMTVRVTVKDRSKIADAAGEAGLTVGEFVRTATLGRKPPRAVKLPLVDASAARPPVGRTRQGRIERQPDCQGLQQHQRGSGGAGIDGHAEPTLRRCVRR